MGKIQDMATKLRKDGSVQAVEKALLNIVKKNESEALDFNRSQLLGNRDSEGESLGEYASIAYANKKGSVLVELKLTGDFQKSFFMETDKFPVVFWAKGDKTEMLTEKYGREIFGLDKVNKGAFAQGIKSEVQAFYRSLIHV